MNCQHCASDNLTCYECYKKNLANYDSAPTPRSAKPEQGGEAVKLEFITEPCDECSAGALVAVQSDSSGHTLYFCGHHYSDHEDVLVTSGFKIIIDDRPELVAT